MEYILVSIIYNWTFAPVRDDNRNIISYEPQKRIEPRISFIYPFRNLKSPQPPLLKGEKYTLFNYKLTPLLIKKNLFYSPFSKGGWGDFPLLLTTKLKRGYLPQNLKGGEIIYLYLKKNNVKKVILYLIFIED
jgi:hypothetical protein